MSGIHQITPFIMTHDLDGALRFYCDILGFSCGFQHENYAFVRCSGGALRLLEVAPDCEIGAQMVYLDCEDVNDVYASMRNRLNSLGKARVRAPFDQPYHQREFHVRDPDNCLLMFGTGTQQTD